MEISRKSNRSLRLVALLALVLSQACLDEDATGPTMSSAADAPDPVSIAQAELGEQSHMLDLALNIPGFAGAYFDPGSSDRFVIAMAGAAPDGFEAVQQAVRSQFATSTDPISADRFRRVNIVERRVRFTFIDLARTRAHLLPHLMGIPGVNSLDVDETRNHIAIGVSGSDAKAAVEELVNALGVPNDMIFFWESARVITATKTNDIPPSLPPLEDVIERSDKKTRSVTLRGGLNVGAVGPRTGNCTLGFTALALPSFETVFVSASHCSFHPFSLDGGSWTHPHGSSTYIGTEIIDPDPQCGLQPCRLADVSVMDATAQVALGEIDVGGSTIKLTGFGGAVWAWQYLTKMGIRTGLSAGPVLRTCEDVLTDRGVWILCSHRVWTNVDGGDSGGPVFAYNRAGNGSLKGTTFGKDNYSIFGRTLLFSDFGSIEQETNYSALWPLADPGLTVTITGPTTVPPNVECEWIAEVVGMGPFDIEWTGILSGSGTTISGVVSSSGGLTVAVRDHTANRTTEASILVTVDSSADGCWDGELI
jgi:hypothetical protein